MKVLVIIACFATAAVAQLQPAGFAAGPLSYEKVVETSAQPEYRVQFQQPTSLLVKSVEQQVPLTGFQQTAYVSGQPAYIKTVEKIENPLLLNGEIQKYEKVEKIEGAQKVQLPAVTTYSGGYEQSAYIQKQPAFASLSGYKTLVAQPALTTYKKEYVTPAVSSYSTFPAASAYKQESFIAAQPALTTYKKEFVAPAVSSYSAFPAASTYKQQSFIAAKPVVSTYKKEFVAPAVSSYSAFPAASAYKQESFIAAKPVVSTYSAFPAASTYKQESFIAAKPAVSTYGAAFQKDSLLYSQSSAKYGGSAMFPGNYQSADGASSILKFYNDDVGTGVYQYGYATSNGINHEEQGKVLASGSKSAEGSSAVFGSYSYPGPDGVTYTVKYTADEQGFRAYGDHLPKLSEEAQHAIDESAKYSEQKDY